MSKKLIIDQKLNQIFVILLGVVDKVIPNKEAYESIKKIVNDERH